MGNKKKMRDIKNIKIKGKHGTLNYLKNQYKNGNRIVVSRYGDGEYFILIGVKKKKVAGQQMTKDLIESLNRSIKKKGQLICLPSIRLKKYKNLKLSDKITNYIVDNSKHDLYGQFKWRDIDLSRYCGEFISEFFVGNTLIVTGFKEACEKAFDNYKKIDVYKTPLRNAAGNYKKIRNDLISISKKYKNIIFGCGPIGKVLIADLIDKCQSHLIDLGSSIGIIIAPYSINYFTVRSWPGYLRRSTSKKIEECSINFFKSLNKKL